MVDIVWCGCAGFVENVIRAEVGNRARCSGRVVCIARKVLYVTGSLKTQHTNLNLQHKALNTRGRIFAYY